MPQLSVPCERGLLGGRKKHSGRARHSTAGFATLALCAASLCAAAFSRTSSFVYSSSSSAPLSGSRALPQFQPWARQVPAWSSRGPKTETITTQPSAHPTPDQQYSSAVRDDILHGLKTFPAAEGPSAGDHINLKLFPVKSGTVPDVASFRHKWGKGALAVMVVSVTTMLLRFATLHLDSWAHSAAAALTNAPSALAATAAGAAAGGLHTLSGPDHLAALAPLAVKVRGGPLAAFRAGIFWGSGHVLGQVLLGLGLLAAGRFGVMAALGAHYGWAVERMSAGAVGAVLVIIGMMGLKEAREWQEDGATEEGSEAHACGTRNLTWKTFGTGVLSGMHPDALLLCLPALALPTRLAGFSYLMAFGVGTLAAMGGYTATLRSMCRQLGPRAMGRISMIASGVAVAVGTAICSTALGIPLLGGLM